MKRIILLLLLISAGYFAKAQYDYPKYEWYYIGAIGGPDFYQYEFNYFGIETNHELFPEFNYSAGFLFGYCHNYFLEFRGALKYSDKSFRIEYDYGNLIKDEDIPFPETAIWDVSYLQIPLYINLNLMHRERFKLFIAGGVSSELFMNSKETVTYDNGVTEESSDLLINSNFSRLQLGAIGSFGFRIGFSEYIGLEFEPYFKYYFNQINPDFMNPNPTSYGVSVGVYLNIY